MTRETLLIKLQALSELNQSRGATAGEALVARIKRQALLDKYGHLLHPPVEEHWPEGTTCIYPGHISGTRWKDRQAEMEADAKQGRAFSAAMQAAFETQARRQKEKAWAFGILALLVCLILWGNLERPQPQQQPGLSLEAQRELYEAQRELYEAANKGTRLDSHSQPAPDYRPPMSAPRASHPTASGPRPSLATVSGAK
jgi:hypothetical protein